MSIKTWQERAGVDHTIVGTFGYEGAMQAEIDELRAELNDERMRCAQADDAVEQMAAELVQMTETSLWQARRISELLDEVAALKGQEPVAHVEIKHMVGVRFHANCEYGCNLEDGAPLFLVAGAQPVQQEPVAKVVLTEKLKLPCMQWLDLDRQFDMKDGQFLYATPVQAQEQRKEQP